jgi:hypothetical protein
VRALLGKAFRQTNSVELPENGWTAQADLHAIFLYYCLLDSSFARHWPPQLTMSGWMAFVKVSRQPCFYTESSQPASTSWGIQRHACMCMHTWTCARFF